MTAKCLLCTESLHSKKRSFAKITECILNDNDRTWCHISCARWHEEIRIESKKRFLYTHKNSLRHNEDKAIEDCFLCLPTDDVKSELLVKCLLCDKYAHPTCLETRLKISKNSFYIDEVRNKFGFVCCSSIKRQDL